MKCTEQVAAYKCSWKHGWNMTGLKDKYMQELKDMRDARERTIKEKDYFQQDLK